MKLHAINNEAPPLGKTLQLRRKTPKIAPLIALTLIFTIIPIYYPYFRYSTIQKFSSQLSGDQEEDHQPIQPSPDQDDQLIYDHSQNRFQESENNNPNLDHHKPENDQENKAAKHPLYRSQNQIQNPEPSHDDKNDNDNPEENHKEKEEKTNVPETYKPSLSEEKRREKRKAKRVNPKRRRRGRGGRGHEEDDLLLKKSQLEEDDLLSKKSLEAVGGAGGDDGYCNLFAGEWIENPEGPYYTNTTCWAIQEHQNCMKFGRPDRDYLKWRWKPYGCELPIFDPLQFLELMRGKALAFVGDSVARNHMQSLICLLSRVAYPVDASNTKDENFKRWEYRDYDFNISIFWSPYLVRTERTDPNDVTRPFNLYLDEFDESWTNEIENFNYVIISAGHWFFRPTMFYINRQLIGCLYCPDSNVVHRPSSFSYRRAFRTAFSAINSLNNFRGIAFLRSFAPSHFEGGPWDKGGDCVRKKPFKSHETSLEDYSLEMYNIQMQEFRIGERMGRRKGIVFRVMDMTQVMQLRPDGHPSKYGHWPKQNVSMANDCVHWCLPGPIDAWNDFLQELLRRENSS